MRNMEAVTLIPVTVIPTVIRGHLGMTSISGSNDLWLPSGILMRRLQLIVQSTALADTAIVTVS